MHRRNCSDRIGSQSRIALSAMSLSSREKGSRPLQPDGALKIHTQGLQSNEMAIESANLGENQLFEQLAEPFRREIKLHCYRMLVIHNDRARDELGWRPRAAVATIVETAES